MWNDNRYLAAQFRAKSSGKANFLNKVSGYALAFALAHTATAHANPTGGDVVQGDATITNPTDDLLQIDQTSDKAIINWQDFSIDHGETTNFNMPDANSAVLNRVTGNNMSEIHGTLRANGRVYLLNQNGVLVGASGIIETGSFVASTLDLTDESFLEDGDLTFSGESTAGIQNLGRIESPNGDVFLIAQEVDNNGEIIAGGTVGLAAGHEVLLKSLDDGNGRISVLAGTGSVTNTGEIRAAVAELAAAGGNHYALAINNTGVIRATGAVKSGGRVLLTAGGKIKSTGKIKAKKKVRVRTRKSKAQIGGELRVEDGAIVVEAKHVEILSDAVIDASGETAGTINIGGGFQGKDSSIENAETLTVEDGAVIRADSTEGDGGEVILWSDDTTDFNGEISARALGETGDGGFVEVSGKETLIYKGQTDTTSANGEVGMLLLDPGDLTITDGALGATSANSIADADLEAALATSSVTIATSSAGGLDTDSGTLGDEVNYDGAGDIDGNGVAGDITIEDGVSIGWDNTTTTGATSDLTFTADGDIKYAGGANGVAIIGDGDITLDAGGAISITTAGDNFTLKSTDGKVKLEADTTIDLSSGAGENAILGNDGVELNAIGSINISSGGTGDVIVASDDGGAVDLLSGENISFDINNKGSIIVHSVDSADGNTGDGDQDDIINAGGLDVLAVGDVTLSASDPAKEGSGISVGAEFGHTNVIAGNAKDADLRADASSVGNSNTSKNVTLEGGKSGGSVQIGFDFDVNDFVSGNNVVMEAREGTDAASATSDGSDYVPAENSDILVEGGEVTLTAGEGNAAGVQIGHGGWQETLRDSSNYDIVNADITVRATKVPGGNVELNGGNEHDSQAQIGHGATMYSGDGTGATEDDWMIQGDISGDITIEAKDGINLNQGMADHDSTNPDTLNDIQAQIGHGGRFNYVGNGGEGEGTYDHDNDSTTDEIQRNAIEHGRIEGSIRIDADADADDAGSASLGKTTTFDNDTHFIGSKIGHGASSRVTIDDDADNTHGEVKIVYGAIGNFQDIVDSHTTAFRNGDGVWDINLDTDRTDIIVAGTSINLTVDQSNPGNSKGAGEVLDNTQISQIGHGSQTRTIATRATGTAGTPASITGATHATTAELEAAAKGSADSKSVAGLSFDIKTEDANGDIITSTETIGDRGELEQYFDGDLTNGEFDPDADANISTMKIGIVTYSGSGTPTVGTVDIGPGNQGTLKNYFDGDLSNGEIDTNAAEHRDLADYYDGDSTVTDLDAPRGIIETTNGGSSLSYTDNDGNTVSLATNQGSSQTLLDKIKTEREGYEDDYKNYIASHQGTLTDAVPGGEANVPAYETTAPVDIHLVEGDIHGHIDVLDTANDKTGITLSAQATSGANSPSDDASIAKIGHGLTAVLDSTDGSGQQSNTSTAPVRGSDITVQAGQIDDADVNVAFGLDADNDEVLDHVDSDVNGMAGDGLLNDNTDDLAMTVNASTGTAAIENNHLATQIGHGVTVAAQTGTSGDGTHDEDSARAGDVSITTGGMDDANITVGLQDSGTLTMTNTMATGLAAIEENDMYNMIGHGEDIVALTDQGGDGANGERSARGGDASVTTGAILDSAVNVTTGDTGGITMTTSASTGLSAIENNHTHTAIGHAARVQAVTGAGGDLGSSTGADDDADGGDISISIGRIGVDSVSASSSNPDGHYNSDVNITVGDTSAIALTTSVSTGLSAITDNHMSTEIGHGSVVDATSGQGSNAGTGDASSNANTNEGDDGGDINVTTGGVDQANINIEIGDTGDTDDKSAFTQTLSQSTGLSAITLNDMFVTTGHSENIIAFSGEGGAGAADNATDGGRGGSISVSTGAKTDSQVNLTTGDTSAVTIETTTSTGLSAIELNHNHNNIGHTDKVEAITGDGGSGGATADKVSGDGGAGGDLSVSIGAIGGDSTPATSSNSSDATDGRDNSNITIRTGDTSGVTVSNKISTGLSTINDNVTASEIGHGGILDLISGDGKAAQEQEGIDTFQASDEKDYGDGGDITVTHGLIDNSAISIMTGDTAGASPVALSSEASTGLSSITTNYQSAHIGHGSNNRIISGQGGYQEDSTKDNSFAASRGGDVIIDQKGFDDSKILISTTQGASPVSADSKLSTGLAAIEGNVQETGAGHGGYIDVVTGDGGHAGNGNLSDSTAHKTNSQTGNRGGDVVFKEGYTADSDIEIKTGDVGHITAKTSISTGLASIKHNEIDTIYGHGTTFAAATGDGGNGIAGKDDGLNDAGRGGNVIVEKSSIAGNISLNAGGHADFEALAEADEGNATKDATITLESTTSTGLAAIEQNLSKAQGGHGSRIEIETGEGGSGRKIDENVNYQNAASATDQNTATTRYVHEISPSPVSGTDDTANDGRDGGDGGDILITQGLHVDTDGDTLTAGIEGDIALHAVKVGALPSDNDEQNGTHLNADIDNDGIADIAISDEGNDIRTEDDGINEQHITGQEDVDGNEYGTAGETAVTIKTSTSTGLAAINHNTDIAVTGHGDYIETISGSGGAGGSTADNGYLADNDASNDSASTSDVDGQVGKENTHHSRGGRGGNIVIDLNSEVSSATIGDQINRVGEGLTKVGTASADHIQHQAMEIKGDLLTIEETNGVSGLQFVETWNDSLTGIFTRDEEPLNVDVGTINLADTDGVTDEQVNDENYINTDHQEIEADRSTVIGGILIDASISHGLAVVDHSVSEAAIGHNQHIYSHAGDGNTGGDSEGLIDVSGGDGGDIDLNMGTISGDHRIKTGAVMKSPDASLKVSSAINHGLSEGTGIKANAHLGHRSTLYGEGGVGGAGASDDGAAIIADGLSGSAEADVSKGSANSDFGNIDGSHKLLETNLRPIANGGQGGDVNVKQIAITGEIEVYTPSEIVVETKAGNGQQTHAVSTIGHYADVVAVTQNGGDGGKLAHSANAAIQQYTSQIHSANTFLLTLSDGNNDEQLNISTDGAGVNSDDTVMGANGAISDRVNVEIGGETASGSVTGNDGLNSNFGNGVYTDPNDSTNTVSMDRLTLAEIEGNTTGDPSTTTSTGFTDDVIYHDQNGDPQYILAIEKGTDNGDGTFTAGDTVLIENDGNRADISDFVIDNGSGSFVEVTGISQIRGQDKNIDRFGRVVGDYAGSDNINVGIRDYANQVERYVDLDRDGTVDLVDFDSDGNFDIVDIDRDGVYDRIDGRVGAAHDGEIIDYAGVTGQTANTSHLEGGWELADFSTANGGRGGDATSSRGTISGAVIVDAGESQSGDDSIYVHSQSQDAIVITGGVDDITEARIGHGGVQFADSSADYTDRKTTRISITDHVKADGGKGGEGAINASGGDGGDVTVNQGAISGQIDVNTRQEEYDPTIRNLNKTEHVHIQADFLVAHEENLNIANIGHGQIARGTASQHKQSHIADVNKADEVVGKVTETNQGGDAEVPGAEYSNGNATVTEIANGGNGGDATIVQGATTGDVTVRAGQKNGSTSHDNTRATDSGAAHSIIIETNIAGNTTTAKHSTQVASIGHVRDAEATGGHGGDGGDGQYQGNGGRGGDVTISQAEITGSDIVVDTLTDRGNGLKLSSTVDYSEDNVTKAQIGHSDFAIARSGEGAEGTAGDDAASGDGANGYANENANQTANGGRGGDVSVTQYGYDSDITIDVGPTGDGTDYAIHVETSSDTNTLKENNVMAVIGSGSVAEGYSAQGGDAKSTTTTVPANAADAKTIRNGGRGGDVALDVNKDGSDGAIIVRAHDDMEDILDSQDYWYNGPTGQVADANSRFVDDDILDQDTVEGVGTVGNATAAISSNGTSLVPQYQDNAINPNDDEIIIVDKDGNSQTGVDIFGRAGSGEGDVLTRNQDWNISNDDTGVSQANVSETNDSRDEYGQSDDQAGSLDTNEDFAYEYGDIDDTFSDDTFVVETQATDGSSGVTADVSVDSANEEAANDGILFKSTIGSGDNTTRQIDGQFSMAGHHSFARADASEAKGGNAPQEADTIDLLEGDGGRGGNASTTMGDVTGDILVTNVVATDVDNHDAPNANTGAKTDENGVSTNSFANDDLNDADNYTITYDVDGNPVRTLNADADAEHAKNIELISGFSDSSTASRGESRIGHVSSGESLSGKGGNAALPGANPAHTGAYSAQGGDGGNATITQGDLNTDLTVTAENSILMNAEGGATSGNAISAIGQRLLADAQAEDGGVGGKAGDTHLTNIYNLIVEYVNEGSDFDNFSDVEKEKLSGILYSDAADDRDAFFAGKATSDFLAKILSSNSDNDKIADINDLTDATEVKEALTYLIAASGDGGNASISQGSAAGNITLTANTQDTTDGDRGVLIKTVGGQANVHTSSHVGHQQEVLAAHAGTGGDVHAHGLGISGDGGDASVTQHGFSGNIQLNSGYKHTITGTTPLADSAQTGPEVGHHQTIGADITAIRDTHVVVGGDAGSEVNGSGDNKATSGNGGDITIVQGGGSGDLTINNTNDTTGDDPVHISGAHIGHDIKVDSAKAGDATSNGSADGDPGLNVGIREGNGGNISITNTALGGNISIVANEHVLIDTQDKMHTHIGHARTYGDDGTYAKNKQDGKITAGNGAGSLTREDDITANTGDTAAVGTTSIDGNGGDITLSGGAISGNVVISSNNMDVTVKTNSTTTIGLDIGHEHYQTLEAGAASFTGTTGSDGTADGVAGSINDTMSSVSGDISITAPDADGNADNATDTDGIDGNGDGATEDGDVILSATGGAPISIGHGASSTTHTYVGTNNTSSATITRSSGVTGDISVSASDDVLVETGDTHIGHTSISNLAHADSETENGATKNGAVNAVQSIGGSGASTANITIEAGNDIHLKDTSNDADGIQVGHYISEESKMHENAMASGSATQTATGNVTVEAGDDMLIDGTNKLAQLGHRSPDTNSWQESVAVQSLNGNVIVEAGTDSEVNKADGTNDPENGSAGDDLKITGANARVGHNVTDDAETSGNEVQTANGNIWLRAMGDLEVSTGAVATGGIGHEHYWDDDDAKARLNGNTSVGAGQNETAFEENKAANILNLADSRFNSGDGDQLRFYTNSRENITANGAYLNDDTAFTRSESSALVANGGELDDADPENSVHHENYYVAQPTAVSFTDTYEFTDPGNFAFYFGNAPVRTGYFETREFEWVDHAQTRGYGGACGMNVSYNTNDTGVSHNGYYFFGENWEEWEDGQLSSGASVATGAYSLGGGTMDTPIDGTHCRQTSSAE